MKRDVTGGIRSRATGLAVILAGTLFCTTAVGDLDRRAAWAAERERQSYVLRSRPHRLDEPLREQNISDDEVREVESITDIIYPGSISSIGGVTEGCPCEDGSSCDSQVWVLAYHEGKYHGLMLSRIDEVWMVGPIQEWWFGYDRFRERYRESFADRTRGFVGDFERYREEQQRQLDSFPTCSVSDGPATTP